MVAPSESTDDVRSVSVGNSLKVTLDELEGNDDWSTLVVTLEEATVATWSRRTNSLYFKGIATGQTRVTVEFNGEVIREFTLNVTN